MTTLANVSAADLKVRYPAFAGVADPTIAACLEEARGSVGASWIESDQKPALLALTAHLLVGAGALGVEDGFSTSGVPISVLKAGDTEVRLAATASSRGNAGGNDGMSSTAYGQRYLDLRMRSFPAVFVL